jgi:hypothetical protein
VSRYSLAQGTIFIWLVLTFISSIMFKSASYVFTWPTILSLLGLTLRPLFKKQSHINAVTFIMFALVLLTVSVIFIPLCYLVYLSMLTSFIPILSVIASLPIGLVVLTAITFLKNETFSNIAPSIYM